MKQYPFIGFVLIFIIGIILSKFFNPNMTQLLIVLIISFLAGLLFYFFIGVYQHKQIAKVLFTLTILSFGAYFFSISQNHNISYPFKERKIKKVYVYGKITDISLIKKNHIKLVLSVDSIKGENLNFNKKISLLCKIFDPSNTNIEYLYNRMGIGNYLLLKGTLAEGKRMRNPGEFDYQKYLESIGISGTMSVSKIINLRILKNNTNWFKNSIFALRKNIDRSLRKLNVSESYALLRGLLLADRSELDNKTKENFINAGVVHVLAVSGLHVGYIVLIFVLLFSRFNIILRYSLTILGILLFLLITGGHAPVLRASVMAVIIIVTFLSNRSTNSFNSLAIAAFIVLLINPYEIFNAGFQLSFSAVLSILIFYPYFRKLIYSLVPENNLIQKLLLFFAVSFAAQIGTLPFTLLYFNKLSIIALFANLIVIPLIGVIIALGIVSLVLSIFWNWAALIYASINIVIIKLLFSFVNAVGSLSISHLDIFEFSVIDTLLFYLFLVFGIVYWNKFRNSRTRLVLFVLLTVNFILFSKFDNSELFPDSQLSVMSMDVGKGDAILAKLPDGDVILIDGGSANQRFDGGAQVIYPLMQRAGINTIDYSFLCSIDNKINGGIFYLLSRKIIKNLYAPKLDSMSSKDMEFKELIDSDKLNFKQIDNGVIPIENSRIYKLSYIENHGAAKKNGRINCLIKLQHGKDSYLFANIYNVYNLLSLGDLNKFIKSDVLFINIRNIRKQVIKKFISNVKPKVLVLLDYLKINDMQKLNEKLQEDNPDYIIKDINESGAVILRETKNKIKLINWKN